MNEASCPSLTSQLLVAKMKVIRKLTFEKLRVVCTGRFTGYRRLSVTSGAKQAVGSVDKKYSFITTPIFYVNSRPHIGHLYTAVIADAYHRFQKIRYGDSQAFLVSGTDEHGIKIEKAAKAAGCKSVIQHCDSVSKQFLNMCDHFSIGYSDFIRTTEDRHTQAVSHFWNRLKERDHIYKSHYEGWYCDADEAFVPESQIEVKEKADGSKIKISIESGHPVEWSSEKNYMFKLSSQMQDVLHWIKNSNPVSPQKFNDILLRMAEEDFQDLSVSRPNSRLSWGIPVPGDSTQVIYVWLDALINYLTVTGYPNQSACWPPTLQVVGKDILKFHGIYWPAFLIAAGLEPPRQLLCHSHWTVDNKKMSKSLGNVVDPILLAEKYGSDGLRYFLLREGTPHSDANFNEEKMRRYLNAELADTLGNLLNRCTAKAINPSQSWPCTYPFNEEGLSVHGSNLLKSLEELPDKVEDCYESCNFYRGLEQIMTTIRIANAFVEEEKPWALAKVSPDNPQLINMLNLVFEALRSTSIMLHPIIPNLSTLALDRLNVSLNERTWRNIRPFLWEKDLSSSNRKLGDFKSVFYSRVKQ